MRRTTYLAMIFSSLALLAGLQSCATREAATGTVVQGDEICGAWLKWTDTNVDCRYKGKLTGGTQTASGSCINDSQVACTYGLGCAWELNVAETVTLCIDKEAACSNTPPEADVVQPGPFTIDLPVGSMLCNEPISESALADFCRGRALTTQFDAAGQARTFCESQSDRNESQATCCIPCKMPGPAGLLPDEGEPEETCTDSQN